MMQDIEIDNKSEEIEIYNKSGEIIDISIPVEQNNIGAVKIADFQKYKTYVDIDFFLGEINTIIFNETGSGSDKNAKRLFRQKILTKIKSNVNVSKLFKFFFNYLCGGSNNPMDATQLDRAQDLAMSSGPRIESTGSRLEQIEGWAQEMRLVKAEEEELSEFRNNPLILIPVGGNPITLFFRLIIHIADATDDEKTFNDIVDEFRGNIDFDTLKQECNLIKPNIIADERFLSLSDCDFNLMPITENIGETKSKAITQENAEGFILTRLKANFKKRIISTGGTKKKRNVNELSADAESKNNEYKAKCFRSLSEILRSYTDVDQDEYLYNNKFIFQQMQADKLDKIINNIQGKDIDQTTKNEAIAYIEFLKNQKEEVALMTKKIINMIASYYNPKTNTFEKKKKNKLLIDAISSGKIDKQHFINLSGFIREICMQVNTELSNSEIKISFNDTDRIIRSSKFHNIIFKIYELLLTNTKINLNMFLRLLQEKYQDNYNAQPFKIQTINTQNNAYLRRLKGKLEALNNYGEKGAKITANILSLNVGNSIEQLKQMIGQNLDNDSLEDIYENYNTIKKYYEPINSIHFSDLDPKFHTMHIKDVETVKSLAFLSDLDKYMNTFIQQKHIAKKKKEGGKKKINKTKRKKKKKHKHTKKRKKYILRKKHKTRKKKL